MQEDITTALLKRLARALGCTTDYLVAIYVEEQEALSAKVAAGKDDDRRLQRDAR